METKDVALLLVAAGALGLGAYLLLKKKPSEEELPGNTGKCGNNTRESVEVCDGTDLNGKTCADYGFTGGILRCYPNCSNFDTSGCTGGGGGGHGLLETVTVSIKPTPFPTGTYPMVAVTLKNVGDADTFTITRSQLKRVSDDHILPINLFFPSAQSVTANGTLQNPGNQWNPITYQGGDETGNYELQIVYTTADGTQHLLPTGFYCTINYTPYNKPKVFSLTAPIIQYVWDEDKPAADYIRNNLKNWLGMVWIPTIKTDQITASMKTQFNEWILIGGQESNPVYNLMTTSAVPKLPNIYPGSPIDYSYGVYNDGSRQHGVYGIAGYSMNDTLLIAQKFVYDYKND